MTLTEYLHQETQIPITTLTSLTAHLFVRREVKKYSTLLKAGTTSKELFYVEEGLLRCFYYKKKKDITHNFFSKRCFIFQWKASISINLPPCV